MGRILNVLATMKIVFLGLSQNTLEVKGVKFNKIKSVHTDKVEGLTKYDFRGTDYNQLIGQFYSNKVVMRNIMFSGMTAEERNRTIDYMMK